MTENPQQIAIIGGGPAGLVAAAALARRGIRTTVLERDADPEVAPRFNPDRSYTIDITGHGLRALRHIDATAYFDARLLPFKGIQRDGQVLAAWSKPGWTGARGDIVRALMARIRDGYDAHVDFRFGCRVSAVDVQTGALTWESPDGRTETGRFGLVVGADGAGSTVRQAMEHQVDGFAVETKALPNWVTMIELDRVDGRLDPRYLQALSIRHFYVAGAIPGDDGPQTPRWFCAIGSRRRQVLSSAEEARELLRRTCPQILELTSDDAVAAFARRPCHHVGQKLTCSRLHAGRCVLLGDAGGPFPPIGQGVNAAMESATVLDRCIGEAGARPAHLLDAAAAYDAAWKPEADAVSWISERFLFGDTLNTLRSLVTMALGVNIADRAKRDDMSYSDVRRKAMRLGPLWSQPARQRISLRSMKRIARRQATRANATRNAR